MMWEVIYIDQDIRNEMELLLGEDELGRLEAMLRMNAGKLGDPIPGLSSVRKLRYPVKSKKKGTRSGARVILAYFNQKGEVVIFDMYEKSKKSDLSRKEIKLISETMNSLKKEAKGGY